MHLSIILLKWKTFPIDCQITAFLQWSETVCTSFEVLCLRNVISDFVQRPKGNTYFITPVHGTFLCTLKTLQHFDAG